MVGVPDLASFSLVGRMENMLVRISLTIAFEDTAPRPEDLTLGQPFKG